MASSASAPTTIETDVAGADVAGADVAGADAVAGTHPGAGPYLRALFLATGVFVAAIGPFGAVILRDRGLEPAVIGFALGVAALATTVLVPAWGHVADVTLGRVRAFQVGVIVAAVAAGALLLPIPIGAVAVIVASFAIFLTMAMSFGDALAVEALHRPGRQYGALRALTSLSFGIAVIAAGVLYDRTGYGAAPIVELVAAAAILGLLVRVPDRTRDPEVRRSAANHGGEEAAGRFGSVSRAFAVQPKLLMVLVTLTVGYAGLQGAVTFVGIRIAELGGQPSAVALSYGLSALMEILGLVVAGWLARRIALRGVFVLAFALYGAIIVSWGILPSPDAINATRPLTGLCFGALIAVQVLAIARLLPAEFQGTGQALVSATTFGLGMVLGDVIGGLEYGAFGPTFFFAFAGALAAVGGIGTWFSLRRTAAAARL